MYTAKSVSEDKYQFPITNVNALRNWVEEFGGGTTNCHPLSKILQVAGIKVVTQAVELGYIKVYTGKGR